MECLEKFMEDSYQRKLRLLAQSKSERYEDTLENYKQIFLAHFALVKEPCDKECIFNNACQYVRTTVQKIPEDEITYFFDELKNIFLEWIDARSIQAIQRFEKLLDTYELLKFNREVTETDIFFKGREEDQILTSWDMFHIPFNKRYLIKNQRFSLTGQPMVYIGSSVIDVAEEIEVEDESRLKISVIRLPSEKILIYDLRSDIYDELLQITVNNLLYEEVEEGYEQAYFFRMILASVCRFEKKQELKGFSFCEEYVIPQMLAQVVKNRKYNGIAYYSTKRYESIDYDGEDRNYFGGIGMGFKENIAIFTQLDAEHVYDRKLFEMLNISVPVDIEKVEKLSIKDLLEIRNEISRSGVGNKIMHAEIIVSSFEKIYGKMKVNGVPYEETELGKLHIYELYTVLSQILVA